MLAPPPRPAEWRWPQATHPPRAKPKTVLVGWWTAYSFRLSLRQGGARPSRGKAPASGSSSSSVPPSADFSRLYSYPTRSRHSPWRPPRARLCRSQSRAAAWCFGVLPPLPAVWRSSAVVVRAAVGSTAHMRSCPRCLPPSTDRALSSARPGWASAAAAATSSNAAPLWPGPSCSICATPEVHQIHEERPSPIKQALGQWRVPGRTTADSGETRLGLAIWA